MEQKKTGRVDVEELRKFLVEQRERLESGEGWIFYGCLGGEDGKACFVARTTRGVLVEQLLNVAKTCGVMEELAVAAMWNVRVEGAMEAEGGTA